METVSARTAAPSDLRRLCRLYGVTTRYHDALGTERVARPEALLAVLRVLGAPVRDDPTRLSDAIRTRELELAQRTLQPVTAVVSDSEAEATAAIQQPAGGADRSRSARLQLEDGDLREWTVKPDELHAAGSREVEGRLWIRRRLPLPGPLPPGRHRLTVGNEASWIIAAPERAFIPEPVAQGRGWGAFVPLYALRRGRDRRPGTFAELGDLKSWISQLGGHAVCTLPLLATFLDEPFQPSPYLPVSRLFWNELFLETDWALEEDREHMDPDALPEGRLTAAGDAPLPGEDLLDYRQTAREKRGALEPLARAFFQGAGEKDPGFRSFLQSRPGLRSYAAFRAATEERRRGWPAWGQELTAEALDAEFGVTDAARYHLWVQWTAHRQLQRVRGGGGGSAELYLDLPLGVHPDGYDTWSRPELFARDVSVGAPPDRFFREGQNWGFPPMLPHRSRDEGHRYVAESIRHSMEACRYLRVDHVMGFQRLFWIPRGMDAVDGVYVRYPAPELLSILCLESRRAETGVVGEDLGTVPRAIRRDLNRRGISRMHVIQFELPEGPGASPSSPPPGSAASPDTHDTPTWAGFCRSLDLQRRLHQGRLTPSEAHRERQLRDERLSALAEWLTREGHLEHSTVDPYGLLRGVLRHLSRGPAGLVMVALEDLWLEEKPQNIPGEPGEVSWRRLLRHSFPEIQEMPEVVDALREVALLRTRGTHP